MLVTELGRSFSGMSGHADVLRWIDGQRERMRDLAVDWAGINSGTYHLDGLARISVRLQAAFGALGGETRELALADQETIDSRGMPVLLPLGKALSIVKRSQSQRRVLLSIHMDTVYAADDPFQRVERMDENTVRGPGVADAKGGLAVMLVALEALERTDLAHRIGWQVLINPDEEIGSPGSGPLLKDCAKTSHVGLVFEPAFPDGSMVAARKGSGNFSVVVRGRAAHAGRDFQNGRNAVRAAAEIAVAAAEISGAKGDVTVNVARIDGGGAVNVVPDLAVLRLNARVVSVDDQHTVEQRLFDITKDIVRRREVAVQVHGGFLSPPKPVDETARVLCDQVSACGRELGLSIQWRSSGGASDGNKLAAAGLPVIDTLGPRGGNLHSPQEFLLLDSLTEKAKLTALFLLKLAAGEIPWPSERNPHA